MCYDIIICLPDFWCMALGIEKAGFTTLALNEFDADACASLRKNRPNWRVIEGDVAEISGPAF